MGRLPTPDEQEWLLAELEELIGRVGFDDFVSRPLWLPSAEHFPDAWTADLAGLERLTQRLLRQSGMSGYRLVLERFEGEREVSDVSIQGEATYRHFGAAAWFAGVEGKTIRFGCAEHQLAEGGEGLVGIMAHEVAHAWRQVNNLVIEDRHLEECLTDLSTIYLGYGVFTVNNTYRFKSYSEQRGGMLYSGYRKSEAGYLSSEAMSFLFAAQMLCRELGCMEAWRLLRWLEPNQRGHARKALRALRPAASVIDRLHPPIPAIDMLSP